MLMEVEINNSKVRKGWLVLLAVTMCASCEESSSMQSGDGNPAEVADALDQTMASLNDQESPMVMGEKFVWDNKLKPPELVNPTCFIGEASLPVFTKKAENSAACEGEMYLIQADKEEDVFIDLQGEVLKKPLLTRSGRNIIVMNGVIDLDVIEGCDVGDLQYAPKDPSLGKSIMPRVPGSRMLGFGNYQVSWVEGMLFLANGHQTDVMIANSGEGRTQTAEDAANRREHFVVNSRAEGWEGTKEYLHGDFIQSQAHNAKSLKVENVTALSAHEWIIFGTNDVWVRNYYADVDPTYGYDDPDSDRGPGLKNHVTGVQTNAATEYYENIHFRLPNGGPYGSGNFGPNPNRFDPRAPAGHDVTAIPDDNLHWIEGDAADFAGNPPPVEEVDFAPTSNVGQNYISPFKYNYCR